ncbi:RdgB/HAM1 family non-canonical purine NTP pyrophosphatase [Acidisoma sp.]|uniref:RdgB/HAM1 family non-canonical purine NTP pyrophosphatase n=1 Tax=Acidisoma sp. TaxID=1872115 RepID=UPI003B00CB07
MARPLDPGTRLVLASHNQGKLSEIRVLLEPWDIHVVSAGDLGLPEPDETEPTFSGNARLKAQAAAGASGLPALADDSGFCVGALDGAPGIYSARWAGPNKDFLAAMQRVHDEAGAAADRSAYFISVLCLAWPDGHFELFEGRVEGQRVWPPRGGRGFGYDPMFQPHGEDETYSEMDPARKTATSHRARAFAALVRGCLGAPPR